MRRLLLAALLVGLVVARTQAQDPKDVIKKAIEAHGGAAKLDKYTAFKTKTKGSLSLMGLELEFSADSTFQAPDKMRTTIALEVMGQSMKLEQKVIAGKASMSLNGMSQPIPEASQADLKQGLVMQKMMQLTPLLTDAGFELKSLGESKVGEKTANGVQVSGKDIKEVKMFFDANSGLLIKIERMGSDPMGGGEVKQEMIFSDFQEVEGMKKPFVSVTMMDGKEFMKSKTTEYKVFEKLDEKEFSD